MGYRVDLKTGECNKFQLTEPFEKIGVSPDDELVGKAEIGSNAQTGEGVEVNIYEGHTERGEPNSEARTAGGMFHVTS